MFSPGVDQQKSVVNADTYKFQSIYIKKQILPKTKNGEIAIIELKGLLSQPSKANVAAIANIGDPIEEIVSKIACLIEKSRNAILQNQF